MQSFIMGHWVQLILVVFALVTLIIGVSRLIRGMIEVRKAKEEIKKLDIKIENAKKNLAAVNKEFSERMEKLIRRQTKNG